MKANILLLKHSSYQLVSLKGRPTKLTPQLAALIEPRLQQTWSPEEIVGAELVGVLRFKTIYSWIHRGFLAVTEKVLRHKGKSPAHRKPVAAPMLKGPLKNDLKKLKAARFLVIWN